jgi:hypothetical protein
MEQLKHIGPRAEAEEFLTAIGLEPNPDAVDQLARVFVPCLQIMCEREHAGDGSTWKRSGWKAQLHEVFKKIERLRERCWLHSQVDGGKETFDAINYLGMFCRGQMDDLPTWAEWGKPGD